MLFLIKFIIQRMLEVYKRAWHVFLTLFAVFLLGAVQIVIYLGEKWYMPPNSDWTINYSLNLAYSGSN